MSRAQRLLDLIQVLRRPIDPEGAEGEDGSGGISAVNGGGTTASDLADLPSGDETPTSPMFFDSDYDAEYGAHVDSGFGSAEGPSGGVTDATIGALR